jgi:type IV secretion system protein VirD4
MKKKWTTFDYIFWGIIIVIASLAGAIGGYIYGNALDPETKQIDTPAFISAISKPSEIDYMGGIKAIRDRDNPYPKYGMALGIGIVVIVIMYRSGTKKRYHRKGEEHGSARWANSKEKKSLGDWNDLYNNFIIGSNVLLVQSRGARERNIPKNRKRYEKEQLQKKLHEYKMSHDPEYAAKIKAKEAEEKRREDERIAREEQKVAEAKARAEKLKAELERNPSLKAMKKQIKSEIAETAPVKAEYKEETQSDIQSMLNLNIMVYGGSGSGKSRFVVKPNILQRNCSFVVTDPSGELLMSCGKMLENNGYKVKAFNLIDMEHSSNYNPFHYVYDYKGKFVPKELIKMINVFMLNTKEEGASGGEQFWNDTTRLLLSAICFLLVERCPIEDQNLGNVAKIIRMAGTIVEGKEDEMTPFKALFEEWRVENPNSLAVQYYDEFQLAAGKTMASVLISTIVRLQNFKLDELTNLTFTDNLELEKLGDEKTALFIIIPSSDKTYNFLAAMMYSQMLDSLMNRAMQKYENQGGELPVHVRFLLDEFANIGRIPDFESVVATIRKYNISVTIILQNLSQLKNMYEKSWGDIIGNCDTTLFLGNKDQITNEAMAKDLGKETIDLMSVNKTKSRQGSTSYNDSIMARELLTSDELSRLDNAEEIVIVRGYPPLKIFKHNLVSHPRYKELGKEKAQKRGAYTSPESNNFSIKTIQTERYVPITDVVAEVQTEFTDNFVDVTFDLFDETGGTITEQKFSEQAKQMFDGTEVSGQTFIPNGFNGTDENVPIE